MTFLRDGDGGTGRYNGRAGTGRQDRPRRRSRAARRAIVNQNSSGTMTGTALPIRASKMSIASATAPELWHGACVMPGSDEKNGLGEEGAKLAKVRNPGSIPMGRQTTALGLRRIPASFIGQFEACKRASSRAPERPAMTIQACRGMFSGLRRRGAERKSERLNCRASDAHGIAWTGCGFRAANGPRHLTLRARSLSHGVGNSL
jgi:hypothetical protein